MSSYDLKNVSPGYITQSLISDFYSNIKHLDSLSRYYARTGFLGIFLCKVSFLYYFVNKSPNQTD